MFAFVTPRASVVTGLPALQLEFTGAVGEVGGWLTCFAKLIPTMSAWLRRDVESGDAHLVREGDVVDLKRICRLCRVSL
jgi:hypothetical protein